MLFGNRIKLYVSQNGCRGHNLTIPSLDSNFPVLFGELVRTTAIFHFYSLILTRAGICLVSERRVLHRNPKGPTIGVSLSRFKPGKHHVGRSY